MDIVDEMDKRQGRSDKTVHLEKSKICRRQQAIASQGFGRTILAWRLVAARESNLQPGRATPTTMNIDGPMDGLEQRGDCDW